MQKAILTMLMLLSLTGLGLAQTLAEMSLVLAITAELDPAIHLPSGSYRAVSDDLEPIIALVPDHEAYENWEVYSAQGIAMNLRPAFVQQMATSFALAGYFPESQTTENITAATHHHYRFSDGSQQTMLYVIETDTELIYFIATAK